MAEDKPSGGGKTLEMRVAALEDKLSKLNITEEEMRAYEKVSSLMGMGGAGTAGAAGTALAAPQLCSISRQRVVFCWRCIIRPIITVCECQCGPCDPTAGGGFGGGGFGSFGM